MSFLRFLCQCLSLDAALAFSTWRPPPSVPRSALGGSRTHKLPVLPLRTSLMSQQLNAHLEPNDDPDLQTDGWKAGNVKQDFDLLRMEVARLNAPAQLAQQERLQLLDELARQRMEIIPQLIRYAKPLFLSMLCCAMLLSRASGARSATRHRHEMIGRLGRRVIHNVANVQFWMVTVCAPLSVYIPKSWLHYQKRKKHVVTEDEEERMKWDPDYIDPSRDCTDYVFCLMENWLSSVYSPILLGIFYLLRQWKLSNSFLRVDSIVSAVPMPMWGLGLATFKAVTRLGSVAATHQYPKFLYQLRRNNQPRPMTRSQSFANRLLRILFQTTPCAIGYELMQCFTFGGAFARQLSAKSMLATKPNALFGLVFLVLMVPSIAHLIALKKIIQIQYFTNVSLSSDHGTFDKAVKDEETYKWRYKLLWREPKRLSQAVESLKRDFLLFYFGDWGTEENENGLQVGEFNLRDEEKKEEPKILQLIREDMERTPNQPNPDRTTWIPYALQRKAKTHQADYDSKNFEVGSTYYFIFHWK